MAKFDLIDSLVHEYKKFNEIKLLGNDRTTTGNLTFISDSSGVTYDTATYGGGTYANTGQTGLMNILKEVLLDYLLFAADINLALEKKLNLVTSASATDAYIATSTGVTSYYDGLKILFKSTVTPNTANCSLNINSLGVKQINKFKNGVQAACETGDILVNFIYELTYNASVGSGVWMIEDPSSVLIDLNSTQTLTNKTLTSPVISTISNGGTVTIPTGTNTLATRAGTETLTNKTIINADGIFDFASEISLFAGENLTAGDSIDFWKNKAYKSIGKTSLFSVNGDSFGLTNIGAKSCIPIENGFAFLTTGAGGIYVRRVIINTTTLDFSYGTETLVTTDIPVSNSLALNYAGSNKFIYSYSLGTASYTQSFDYSGTTVTNKSSRVQTSNTYSSGFTSHAIGKIGTNKFIVFNVSANDSNRWAVVATLSGSSLTLGTPVLNTLGNAPYTILELGTDTLLVHSAQNGDVKIFTVSGTTIDTSGSLYVLGSTANMVKISETEVFVSTLNAIHHLSISGKVITVTSAGVSGGASLGFPLDGLPHFIYTDTVKTFKIIDGAVINLNSKSFLEPLTAGGSSLAVKHLLLNDSTLAICNGGNISDSSVNTQIYKLGKTTVGRSKATVSTGQAVTCQVL